MSDSSNLTARVVSARSGEQRRGGREPLHRAGEHEVLERASDSQVHLPQERIDRAQRTLDIEVNINTPIPECKPPRLAIVRIRSQHPSRDDRAQAALLR